MHPKLGTTGKGSALRAAQIAACPRGSSEEQATSSLLEEFNKEDTNPSRGRQCRGKQQGLGSLRSCCSYTRKGEFPLEKASKTKSQAEAEGLAGSLAPSSTAQLRVKATNPLPFFAATSGSRRG